MSGSRTKPSQKNSCIQLSSSLFNYTPRVFPENWSRRFKSATYLPGHFLIGKGGQLPSKDGRGAGNLIAKEMATAALKNKVGMSYCYVSPWNIALLVSSPDDVKMMLKENHDSFYLHDYTGSFKVPFGDDTTFAKEYGTTDHAKARQKYTSMIGPKNRLDKDAIELKKMFQRHAEEVLQKGILEVGEFASLATMEAIATLKLGMEKFDKSAAKEVSEIISEITVQVATGKLQVSKKILQTLFFFTGYAELLSNKVVKTVQPFTELGKKLKQGEKILEDKFVKPNLKNISETQNLLHMDMNSKVNLNEKKTTDFVKEVFVAGHDTTKVLFRSCLMLLADTNHKHVLEKLRTEVAKLKSDWQRDDLMELKYLDWVVKEALRLYPPVPDMIFAVKETCEFADGKLYPGDLAVISPRVLHLNPKVWGEDANQFNPDRFEKGEPSPYQFIPFGFEPKICPGQPLAKLEVKVGLVTLLQKFDFEFVNNNLHHPFPYNQVFTLRFDEEKTYIKFSARKSLELDCVEEQKEESKRFVI